MVILAETQVGVLEFIHCHGQFVEDTVLWNEIQYILNVTMFMRRLNRWQLIVLPCLIPIYI